MNTPGSKVARHSRDRFFLSTFSLCLSAFFAASSLYALPVQNEVAAGEASFQQIDDSTLQITASNGSIINYSSFDILRHETVEFFLPSTDSFSLNRVLGAAPSQILGTLKANGNLILVNQNGFHFGPEARVDAQGLIASAHDISNSNFLSGRYLFAGLGDAVASSRTSILNEGFISAREGGMAILIGDAVENRGTVEAPGGMVSLAAGNAVTVGISRDGLVSVIIDESTQHPILDKDGNPITEQIKNSGTLRASKVRLDAQAMDQVFESAINLEGFVQADGFESGPDGAIQAVANQNIKVHADLNAEQGEIKIESSKNIVVSGDTRTQGHTVFKADENIEVKADLTTDSGDLELLADADLDGRGAFLQDADTTVRTTTFGDITIASSGESTLAHLISAGDIHLKQGGAPVTYTQHSNSRVETQGSLHIHEGVTLRASNAQFEIRQNWINAGTFIGDASLVRLTGTREAFITGSNTFHDFEVIEPEKSLVFEADKTQTFTGTLTLNGSFGKLLRLRSSQVDIPWKIQLLGSYNIDFVDTRNSSNILIHGPPIQSLHTKNSLGNTGWDFSLAGPVWTGNGQTPYWSDKSNWDGGFVPSSGDRVRFTSSSSLSIIDPQFEGTIQDLIMDSDYSGTLIFERDLSLNGKALLLGGTLKAGSGGQLRLNASGDIFSEASLIGAFIHLEAVGNISSLGILKADRLFEKGAAFLVGGVYEVGFAQVQNLDNAITLNTGNFSGETADTGDIIVNTGAVITLTANATFRADSDGDGNGAFTMLTGSSITTSGGARNLTLFTSQNSTLRTISGIGTLTLSRSSTSSNPVYTANNTISGTGLTVDANLTFSLNGQTLSFASSAAVSNSGTFRLQGAETLTNVTNLDINSGTVEYVGDGDAASDTFTIKDFGSTDYHDFRINSTDGTTDTFTLSGNLKLDGDFTLTNGIFNQSSFNIEGRGFTQSAGTFNNSTGTGTILFNGSASIASGATFNTPQNTMEVITLAINGTMVMGTNGSLEISGSGTPLTGTGTLNTTTNTPNTVEFSGPGVTNISAATPVSSYHNLTLSPDGFEERFTEVLDTGVTPRSAAIDTVNGFAYFGTNSGGKIVKVRLADTSEVAILTLSGSAGTIVTGHIDTDAANFFGYFTSQSTGNVYKVNLTTFTEDSFVAGATVGVGAINGSVIDATATSIANRFLIVGGSGGKVSKIRLSDLNVLITSSTIGSGAAIAAGGIDLTRDFAYFSNTASPGQLFKIDTSDLSIDGSLTFSGGEQSAQAVKSIVIDETNGFAYLGSGNSGSAAKIIKVNIQSPVFSSTSANGGATVTLNSGEEIPFAAVIDTTNSDAYFLTNNSTDNFSKVVEIDIATGNFTRVSALSLSSGSDDVQAAAIDITGGFLYLGAITNPGRIVQVSLGSTSMRIGTASSQTLSVTNNLAIGDGTNEAIINASTFNPVIDVNGAFTVNNNGFFTAGSSTFSVAGNFTLNATSSYTKGTGTLTLDGTANLADNNSTKQDLGNVVISGSVTRTLTTAVKMTALTINSGNIFSLGGFNFQFSSAASVVNNGTFSLFGSETLTNVNDLDLNSGTVDYIGDGDASADTFTIKDFGSTDYFNLNINPTDNNDTFQLGSNVDIDGAFTLSKGTFNQATSTMNVAGNFSIAAAGTTFTKASGGQALTFDGTGTLTDSTASLQDLGNVVIGGTSITRTLAASVKMTALTINSGNVFSLDGNDFTFISSTSVSNSGTFRLKGNGTETLNSVASLDTDSGTVEYVGDADSAADTFTLNELGATDYFNLLINPTDSNETFQASSGLTVAGATTVTRGTLDLNFSNGTYTGLVTVNGGTFQSSTATQTLNGGLTISSGTFTGSTGTVDINGNFSLSGGTFTAPSGNTQISGDFTISGGTFTPGTGTVVFDGGAATLDVPTSQTFNNLTFNPATTGASKTVANGDSLIVTGTLTLTEGTVDQTSVPADGTLAARGNISQATTFDGGTGILGISGTASQTFTGGGSSSSGTLPDIRIDKSSGTLTLSSTIRTTNDWAFLAGTVNAGSSTVVFAGTLTLDGQGTSTTMAFNHVTVNGGTTTLGGNLDVDGNLSVTSGTFAQAANNVSIAGNLTLTNGTTFTKATGAQTLTFDGNGTLTDNNTTKQDLGNVVIGGTSTSPLLGAAVQMTALTINVGNSFSLAGFNFTFTSSAALINNGTFILRGEETLTNVTSLDIDSGTVTYEAQTDSTSDTFTLKDFGATDYFNLAFIGTADTGDIFQLTSALSAAGTLSATGTNGTLNANGNNITIAGTSTLNRSGSNFLASTGTVTFNGNVTLSSGTLTAGAGSVVVNANTTVSGGTFTGSTGALDLNGNLTLSGGTFTAPTGTFTISGNFNRTGGTFAPGTGTVTFDGTDQTITGSTTFNGFSKTTFSTLTFPAGQTQTFTGTLTLQGISTSAGLLRSSSSGAAWNIDAQGSTSLRFLDVQDINNIGSAQLNFVDSIDSGNNGNLVFTVTPPPSTNTLSSSTLTTVTRTIDSATSSATTVQTNTGTSTSTTSTTSSTTSSSNTSSSSSSSTSQNSTSSDDMDSTSGSDDTNGGDPGGGGPDGEATDDESNEETQTEETSPEDPEEESAPEDQETEETEESSSEESEEDEENPSEEQTDGEKVAGDEEDSEDPEYNENPWEFFGSDRIQDFRTEVKVEEGSVEIRPYQADGALSEQGVLVRENRQSSAGWNQAPEEPKGWS